MQNDLNLYKNRNFYKKNVRVNILLKKHFSIPAGYENPVVLDLGCGAGANSRYLMDRGYKVISYDINTEAKEIATELHNINVILKDIVNINLTENELKIFLIIFSYVSQHIQFNDLSRILNDISNNSKIKYFLYSHFEVGHLKKNHLNIFHLNNWKLCDTYKWKRLDTDHDEPHYHIGYDYLLINTRAI